MLCNTDNLTACKGTSGWSGGGIFNVCLKKVQNSNEKSNENSFCAPFRSPNLPVFLAEVTLKSFSVSLCALVILLAFCLGPQLQHAVFYPAIPV